VSASSGAGFDWPYGERQKSPPPAALGGAVQAGESTSAEPGGAEESGLEPAARRESPDAHALVEEDEFRGARAGADEELEPSDAWYDADAIALERFESETRDGTRAFADETMLEEALEAPPEPGGRPVDPASAARESAAWRGVGSADSGELEPAESTSESRGEWLVPEPDAAASAAPESASGEPDLYSALDAPAAPASKPAKPAKAPPAARAGEPPKVLRPAPPAAARARAEPEVVLDPAPPQSKALSAEGLIRDAGCLIVEQQRVAVSMLQRRFQLDFKQATELLDELQARGLIGPYLGGTRRDILLTREEWLERAVRS
jgi:hypothetical protein